MTWQCRQHGWVDNYTMYVYATDPMRLRLSDCPMSILTISSQLLTLDSGYGSTKSSIHIFVIATTLGNQLSAQERKIPYFCALDSFPLVAVRRAPRQRWLYLWSEGYIRLRNWEVQCIPEDELLIIDRLSVERALGIHLVNGLGPWCG